MDSPNFWIDSQREKSRESCCRQSLANSENPTEKWSIQKAANRYDDGKLEYGPKFSSHGFSPLKERSIAESEIEIVAQRIGKTVFVLYAFSITR